MAAEIVPMPSAGIEPSMLRVITYPTSDAVIAQLGAECADLSPDTAKGYEAVRVAIGNLRALRVSVEGRRKDLKEGALDYGRKVDAEAKRLTGLIEAIEEPLKAKKQAVDDEKARIKAAEEEAKLEALREEIRQNEARQAAERRAEEERQAAERKAAQEAEERRLADQRAALDAERARLAEERRVADERAALERAAADEAQRLERARLDAERAALAADRERIAAEQRRIDEAKAQADREEAARQARLKAEQDARDRAERERIDAEEARVREAERQAALAARLEAIKPDAEKVSAFAAQIRALSAPDIADEQARGWIADAVLDLSVIAERLDGYVSSTVVDVESFS